jgi:acyl-CoA synthetase (AMP-forming)/AMP-acid ligase II
MSFFSASVLPQNSWSSLGQLFFRRVSELGCRTFLKIQRCGSFEDKSWRDFDAMVQSTLLGLHQLGMAKEATREAFDADGWFRTADLAKIDNEGALYIGRKKDLFNCADGSNITPGTVEALLQNDSFIRQAL